MTFATGAGMVAFDFKVDTGGARVVVAKLPLSNDCATDEAVDAAIATLKADLDVVGERMKGALARRAKTSGDVIPMTPRAE
jgi:hypothetical protein